MPQNIVPQLDITSAYIYCPHCQRQGTRTILRRDSFMFKCEFAHNFEYGQLQAMADRGELVEMVKTHVIEQPADSDVKQQIWVNPVLWERLNAKFSGRILVTLRTVFAALADDSIIFIEGPEIKELKLQGVKNGKDIVALIRNAQQLEQDNQAMQKKLELLAPLLQAAGLPPVV